MTEAPPLKFEGARGIWRYVRPHGRTLALLLILGLVSAVANGSVPYVTGQFMDALIGVSRGEVAYFRNTPVWVWFLILWTLVQFTANAVDWASDRLQRWFNTTVEFELQVAGFMHFLRLPLSYHTNTHIQGELSKLSSTSWRITSIIRTVVQVAPQLVSVIIGIVLALSINTTLAGILALGVVVYVALLVPMLIPIAAADREAHEAWNNTWNDAAAAVVQASSVKQAAAEEYQERHAREAFLVKARGLWSRLDRTWSNISSYQRMVVFLTQLAVFVVSVGYVSEGIITVGELIALNGYAMLFFGPFVSLGYSWQIMQNGITAAASLERIMRLPEEEYHPVGAHLPEVEKGVVTFDHVRFSYGDEENPILNDLSFTTKAGEMIAVVGESGAGKSTAISLISGYYFPDEGSVLVDGVDTRSWDLTELRRRIAIVPQEVALFNDTIAANIRYGAFDASQEAVEAAARQAHIDTFIESLPQGYETVVGERGVKLSVGQKQRVAIARAVLRDPKILILDEPTSALDSQTEKLITASLEQLMQGRTTFVIAHRLSTVRKADRIIVLAQGRVVEQGTHQELMALEEGAYRRMYELHIGLSE